MDFTRDYNRPPNYLVMVARDAMEHPGVPERINYKNSKYTAQTTAWRIRREPPRDWPNGVWKVNAHRIGDGSALFIVYVREANAVIFEHTIGPGRPRKYGSDVAYTQVRPLPVPDRQMMLDLGAAESLVSRDEKTGRVRRAFFNEKQGQELGVWMGDDENIGVKLADTFAEWDRLTGYRGWAEWD